MSAKTFAPDDPALPMNYPGFVFRTLCEDGHDAEALLAGTGLTPVLLHDPNFRTGFAPLRQFFLNAMEQTGDPHLGITLAQRFEATYVGLPAYAAMNAARFKDALGVLGRFFFLTFPAIDFRFPDLSPELERGAAAVCLRPKFPFEDITYFGMSSALIACNGLFKAILRAPRVVSYGEMTTSEPEGWAEMSAGIGFPIRFEAREHRLVFPAELLTQPLPASDPINHLRLLELCQKLAVEADYETTLRSRVLSFLEKGRNLAVPLSEAAAALGYSERGLRRHLERSGTSYRDLTDQVRESRARELLAGTAQPIQAIAHALGYETPSNFARSFKRWTGVTPTEFRAAQRGRANRGPH
ncbi:MAG: AraC family transcriptional regulator ligand-binding domain-containing protein [Myxococcota bacterium]